MCNDRSDEEFHAHIEWDFFTCHVKLSREVFQKNSHLTSSCHNRLAAWVVANELTEGANMYISSFFVINSRSC